MAILAGIVILSTEIWIALGPSFEFAQITLLRDRLGGHLVHASGIIFVEPVSIFPTW
jgi:hypothetical protein